MTVSLLCYSQNKTKQNSIYYKVCTKFPCSYLALTIQSNLFVSTMPFTTLKLNHLGWKIFDMPFIPTL